MTQDSAVQDGTQETPSSEGSESKAGQQSSATDSSVAQTLATLQKQVELLSRSLQSDKDRAVKQTNKRLDNLEGDLRTVLQAAQSAGKDVGSLLKDLDEEEERQARQASLELLKMVREGTLPVKPQGSGGNDGVKLSEVLEDLELDVTDVRVKEFSSRQFASQDEAYREAAKLRKQIKTIQPTDADKPGDVAKRAESLPKQEQLMQEYQQGSKGLFGADLMNFKQKMREKGLRIS